MAALWAARPLPTRGAVSSGQNIRDALLAVAQGDNVQTEAGGPVVQIVVPPTYAPAAFCAPRCYVHCAEWMASAWALGAKKFTGDRAILYHANALSGIKPVMLEEDQPYQHRTGKALAGCTSARLPATPAPHLPHTHSTPVLSLPSA